MLTKDERHRLGAIIASVTRDIESTDKFAPASEYTLGTIQWVAVALKKANDELNRLTCTCKDNSIGLFPVLHKCKICGYEGGYRQVHEKCEGCQYNQEKSIRERNF